jgi:hypothetical protein
MPTPKQLWFSSFTLPPSDEGGKRKGKQAAEHKRNGWKILLLIGIGEFEKPPSPPLQWPFGEIYSNRCQWQMKGAMISVNVRCARAADMPRWANPQ